MFGRKNTITIKNPGFFENNYSFTEIDGSIYPKKVLDGSVYEIPVARRNHENDKKWDLTEGGCGAFTDYRKSLRRQVFWSNLKYDIHDLLFA